MSAEEFNQEEKAAVEESTAEDTYHNPEFLFGIPTWANILAWLILAVYVAQFGIRLVAQFQSGFRLDMQNVFNLVSTFSILLVAGFYFIALRVISEFIYLLKDIEENTLQIIRERQGKE